MLKIPVSTPKRTGAPAGKTGDGAQLSAWHGIRERPDDGGEMHDAQRHFRFRFVSRGDSANRLTALSVRALLWTHPQVRVTVIDANDEQQLAAEDFSGTTLLHIPPRNDAVAAKVGRGTRKHIFFWRHSPELLAALPNDTPFSAYIDSDIILMRPMDLSALHAPLTRGRIGAAVDESSLAYSGLLQERSKLLAPSLMEPGGGGPLLQAGLIFSHSRDDGGLYQEFWRLAARAAARDIIEFLPFDDMALLSMLLTQGGTLWDRLLPLGHLWNYITAADKDPGVFAIGAHYGGFRAKAFLLNELDRFTAPANPWDGWGSNHCGNTNGCSRFARGVIPGHRERASILHRVVAPFALSWWAVPGTKSVTLEVRARRGDLGPLLLYIDGRFRGQIGTDRVGCASHEFALGRQKIATLIAPPDPRSDGAEVELRRSFPE